VSYIDRFTGKPIDRIRLPKLNGETCDECGSECIDNCIICGAPQCCPACCAEACEPTPPTPDAPSPPSLT